MSEPRIAALIPPTAPELVPRSTSALSPAPPLPTPPPPRGAATWSYSTVKLDASGRFACQAQLEALDWTADTRLTLTVWHGIVVAIRQDSNGAFAVGCNLRLQIPAAIRGRCALRARDQVLLAVSQPADILLIYTLPLLERLLWETHERITSGDES